MWALIPAALVIVFVFMLTNDKLSMSTTETTGTKQEPQTE
jgi:hypothetical protein